MNGHATSAYGGTTFPDSASQVRLWLEKMDMAPRLYGVVTKQANCPVVCPDVKKRVAGSEQSTTYADHFGIRRAEEKKCLRVAVRQTDPDGNTVTQPDPFIARHTQEKTAHNRQSLNACEASDQR